jgi:sulfur-oxidizing protein SoxX
VKRSIVRCLSGIALAAASVAGSSAVYSQEASITYRIDNGKISAPLTREAGDAARGRAAVLSRDSGNCFLCHSIPDAGETPLGDIGPPLAGIGRRLTAAQLRLRLVDSTRINPQSVMPAYYRTEGLHQVAAAYRGKPLLTAQQIEDVIVYLTTLRN